MIEHQVPNQQPISRAVILPTHPTLPHPKNQTHLQGNDQITPSKPLKSTKITGSPTTRPNLKDQKGECSPAPVDSCEMNSLSPWCDHGYHDPATGCRGSWTDCSACVMRTGTAPGSTRARGGPFQKLWLHRHPAPPFPTLHLRFVSCCFDGMEMMSTATWLRCRWQAFKAPISPKRCHGHVTRLHRTPLLLRTQSGRCCTTCKHWRASQQEAGRPC